MASTVRLIESRPSPISYIALILLCISWFFTVAVSLATQLSFPALPDLLLLISCVIGLDFFCRFAPQTPSIRATQTLVYGVLYLALTCFCGVLSAYAAQRLAFPLQDDLFLSLDRTMGLNWPEFLRWVERHRLIHDVLNFAYETMAIQISLPVVVLAVLDRVDEVQRYLVSFALALMITTAIAAFLPVLSYIAFTDRADFATFQFPGATPLNHLALLRSSGAIQLSGDLGGVLGFPSFHASVAVLTPLVLRRYTALLLPLLLMDVAMLCSTLTEGAHYGSDAIVGGCVAITAHLVAGRTVEKTVKSTMVGTQSAKYGAQPEN